MALCRTGGVMLRCVKPILTNPCFIVPSSVSLQVRHAARKGFRDKMQRAKKAAAVAATPVVSKEANRVMRKYTKIEKTVDLSKPEPPPDDVIMFDLFNYKKFTLSEAVVLHREYHHPEVYNNPNAAISVRIEINMTGKKKTQFIKPFHGVASIPHPFVISHKREILVLCNPEDKELALSCGASVAGGLDVIKKIKEGSIQPSLYDYVIAHTNFLPNLTPVRSFFKDQLPKAKVGTLTNDLKSAISRFLHGIEYSCVRIGTAQDFGFMDCYLGTIDMQLEHLEENFKALITDIEEHRPPRDGDFISWVWCTSRPSTEEFSIDLSKYLSAKTTVQGDEDEEEVLSEKDQERQAKKKLIEDLQEEEIISKA